MNLKKIILSLFIGLGLLENNICNQENNKMFFKNEKNEEFKLIYKEMFEKFIENEKLEKIYINKNFINENVDINLIKSYNKHDFDKLIFNTVFNREYEDLLFFIFMKSINKNKILSLLKNIIKNENDMKNIFNILIFSLSSINTISEYISLKSNNCNFSINEIEKISLLFSSRFKKIKCIVRCEIQEKADLSDYYKIIRRNL